MQQFDDRIAVVVGAGGVGTGVATGLVDAGMRVVIADREQTRAERAAAAVGWPTAAVHAAALDASDPDALRAFATDVERSQGPAAVVVAATGVLLDRSLDAMTEREWAWLWEQNVMAQVVLVGAFLSQLRSTRGHVVLTAAGAGLGTPDVPGLGGYATVKHAVVGYARSLRAELAATQVGVTVLVPTRVRGDLAATSASSHATFAQSTAFRGGQPPTPDDLVDGGVLGPVVVEAIRSGRFLASNDVPALRRLVDAEHARVREALSGGEEPG